MGTDTTEKYKAENEAARSWRSVRVGNSGKISK